MKGPLDYLARWPLRLWLAMVGAFLYLPLLALVVFNFPPNAGNIGSAAYLSVFESIFHTLAAMQAQG